MTDNAESISRSTIRMVAKDLRAARKPRLPLLPLDLTDGVSFLSLATWQRPAPGVTPEEALHRLVRRAISRLSATDRQIAHIYFGLTTETEGESMSQRYARIGEIVSMDPNGWRVDQAGPLTERVAERLLRADQRFLGQQRRNLADEGRHPTRSRLRIDWLARLQLYSRTETAVVALNADVNVYLEVDRGRKARAPQDEYAQTSLYWLSLAWLLDEERYTSFGGSWLLTDPIAEEEAADAFYALTVRIPPFTQRQQSRLRVMLREVPTWELDPFCASLVDDQADLLGTWRTWLSQCACRSLDYPAIDCPVHELRDQVDLFSEAIRSTWNDLTDWYVATAESPTDPRQDPWHTSPVD